MENYLILYIDVEFIVGVVSTGYGSPHLVGQNAKGDGLMWLYFFNDPCRHEVSYGKSYKVHFLDGKYNYYGNFLSNIENEENDFELRHTRYPLVDLLDMSGMLEDWRQSYTNVTQTESEVIPTLLTFSSSVSDLAKQRFVDYLRGKGFDVKSYTIPLSELAVYKLVLDKKVTAGHTALMLEATNSVLHLSKLICSDSYFLKDGKVKSVKGKGIDPRKRALCRFLVLELNSQLGALRTDDEQEQEILRFEPHAAEWLKTIERQRGDRPSLIKGLSFQRMINTKRDILVRLADIDKDTGRYLTNLTDEYRAFKEENCPNGIDFCCFVGNCFVSERIKKRFTDLIGEDNIFFFKTTDVTDIIGCYPRIDLQRYADQENRIREQAKAEELKKTEEREAEKRRLEEKENAEREAKRIAEERQAKEDAEKAYQKALDLDKKGNLMDAKSYADNAVALAPDNLNYRKIADFLSEKITKHREILTLYKGFLSKGDDFFSSGDFKKALVEYEKAKAVDDNAEIKGKIIECEVVIKEEKERQITIATLLSELNVALQSEDLIQAETKHKAVLLLDPDNEQAKSFGETIEKKKKEIEEKNKIIERKKTADGLVRKGKDLFNNGDLDSAFEVFKESNTQDPQNKDAKIWLKKCKDAIRDQKLKVEMDELKADYLLAMQQKDIQKAAKLCDELICADNENASLWQKEKEHVSYLTKLSSIRFVKGEFASIKALLRLGKKEEAKEKLDFLENGLHWVANTDLDNEIDSIRKAIKGEETAKGSDSKESKSEGSNSRGGAKPDSTPELGFAEETMLSDRLIKSSTREIKALISTKRMVEAWMKINELKQQISSSDFQKFGLSELLQKLKESN